MTEGRVVQVGTADALFERPEHTFVGHFIGSPGMNFLPAAWRGAGLEVAGRPVAAPEGADVAMLASAGEFTLGVRPEYVTLAPQGAPGVLAAQVLSCQDVGTYGLLTARIGDTLVRARLGLDEVLPAAGAEVGLRLVGARSCFYRDGQLLAAQHMEPVA
jgi:glycerol transport system ATP-binding protein